MIYELHCNASDDEHAPDWRVEFSSASLEEVKAARERESKSGKWTEIQINSWDPEGGERCWNVVD